MAVIDMNKLGILYAEGTLDSDLIIGTNSDDVIFGNHGVDVLRGNGGNDVFVINGANGFDHYDGGAGHDIIYADHSKTAHYLFWSEVQIGSMKSIEEIRSDGVVPTHVVVENTVDLSGTILVNIGEIRGTANNNHITGSAQNDKIFGYDGNDTLNGGQGNDVLDGGNGNDVLNGGVGADTMIGGTGDDTYYVDNVNDVVVEAADGGVDTVGSSIGHALSAHVENLQLLGTAGINGIGNGLDNVLIGNSGANILAGNEGNDTLSGGAGNDTLLGGVGNDYLQGDEGNDQLIGGDGVDRLFGGNGNDALAGQGGNDELTGGAGADQFWFNLNGGVDVITDYQDGVDKIVLGSDIVNVNVFTHSDGSAVLELSNNASSAANTYVLLLGVQPSQIDGGDFLWAA